MKLNDIFRYYVLEEIVIQDKTIRKIICFTLDADSAENIARIMASQQRSVPATHNVIRTTAELDNITEYKDPDAIANDIVFRFVSGKDLPDAYGWQPHAPYITGEEDFTANLEKIDYTEKAEGE